jgi:hypothetical protein
MSYWFRNKRYGYGASPANWKGWLSIALFVALQMVIALTLGPASAFRIAAFAILTVLFAWVVWRKTDGAWRWRWGSDDNNDGNP